ncbi:MAG: hypothetical protein NTW13_03130 [Candidatus Omnitrophica bacterium]|nr:hypothetical protein [Candidatus Omnitrophota bacterium]
MRYAIVATTIYKGEFIDSYYEHLVRNGDIEKVNFYIVGDINTPEDCRSRVDKYRKQGLPWYYLGTQEQDEFLKPFPELASEIPWNSDNRRNVGFLMAYRDKCEAIISIDDDNYPKSSWPFIKGHSSLGREFSLPTVQGDAGWFNICSLMDVKCDTLGVGGIVYPRGFPYARRSPACSKTSSDISTGIVAVNVGLWSGDPDVDAATRLVNGCSTSEKFTSDYLLAEGSIIPVNSQNTGLIREAVPAYYYVKMGYDIKGMKLDRFGDIFSGFFLQKCVQAKRQRIKIGSPVLEHRRSLHNLYKDLWNELVGMVIIDDILPLLETPLSQSANYGSAMLELSGKIEEWSVDRQGFLWEDSLRDYFKNVSRNIRLWVEACRQLN